MKYFIDNCISFRFADMLRALGVEIVALREEFPQDMADIALFKELNGRKPAFISTDTSQRACARGQSAEVRWRYRAVHRPVFSDDAVLGPGRLGCQTLARHRSICDQHGAWSVRWNQAQRQRDALSALTSSSCSGPENADGVNTNGSFDMNALPWNRIVRVVVIAYVFLLVVGAIYFVSAGGLVDVANWVRREVLFPIGP